MRVKSLQSEFFKVAKAVRESDSYNKLSLEDRARRWMIVDGRDTVGSCQFYTSCTQSRILDILLKNKIYYVDDLVNISVEEFNAMGIKWQTLERIESILQVRVIGFESFPKTKKPNLTKVKPDNI